MQNSLIKLLWIFLMGISVFLFQDQKSVNVYRMEASDGFKVYAKNNNIYPVTVELELELRNLKPNRNLPYIGMIKGYSNEKILDLEYIDKNKGWDYNSRYRYYMGNIFAQHDDNVTYLLPYQKGVNYLLEQGYNGSFSHKGDVQYALDFDMPEGTAIFAARTGTVVQMEDSNTLGGPDEDMMDYANYITILHEDGTFADYSHLQKDGALVEIGQRVQAGQLIGYSGATGFATGPHLHFMVKKAKRGGGFVSIPVKFSTKEGIIELREGERYAGN